MPDVRTLVLLVVGFGCLVASSRMLSLGFVGYYNEGVYSSTDSWYLLRTAVSIATLALLALAGRNRWFSIGDKTLGLATAAMVGCTIVFAVDVEGTFGPVVAAAAGASDAVLLYVWFMLLATYRPPTIVFSTVASLLVSWVIISGTPMLDSALALVVAVGAAFVCGAAAFMLDSDLSCCKADGPLSASESLRVPWLTVVTVIVCGLYAMVLYAVADQLAWLYDWSANGVVFAIGVVGAIAGTAILMLRTSGWKYTAWMPMFVLVAIAIVLSCLPMRETFQIAAGCMLAAVFCAHFLYWMIFPAMLSDLRVPRAFLAGIMLIFSNGSLASSVGNALAAVLPRSMQSLGSVAGMMAIVLCAIFAVAFVLSRHTLGAVGVASGLGAGVQGMPASDSALVSDEEGGIVARAAGDAEAVEAGAVEAGAVEVSAAKAGAALGEAGAVAQPGDASDTAGATAQAGEGQDGAADSSTDLSEGDVAEDAASAPNPLDLLKTRLDVLTGEYGLTPREHEIAFYTVQGFSCAYIAEKLVVSNSTVRFHQQNLYRKLDVHSRNELIEFVNGGGE